MHQATAQNNSLHKGLYYLITLAVLVNFSGLFIPLMDPDAGVYASISKNMAQRNDYINLWFQDKDWLDKPHFQFWVTALFFKLFGIHTWAYKLPGILFALMGGAYTYLFTKKYYDKTTALLAAFVLLTAQHFIISNNDVRAEPFLTGLVIAAVYHFSNAISKNISWQLVIGCLFAACAVMTKGIYTIIPIGAAIAGELFIKKQWQQIFHWRWIVALALLIIFISPELYSLWVQFDSHPEKIQFGKTNVSGIKFFLWDSQFGRFASTGPIKGKGDITYFLHTLLWAFLPWCIVMYAAVFTKIKDAFKKTVTTPEWFTISGSLVSLLLFSVSQFQLPYYTNIIFPFLAVLSAAFIVKQAEKVKSAFTIIQYVIAAIIICVAIALFVFYKPSINIISIILLAGLFISLLLINNTIKAVPVVKSFLHSGTAVLLVSLFLNLVLYPDLLKYQSGNEAAFYINKNYPATPAGRFDLYIPSAEFYLKEKMNIIDIESVNKGGFAKQGLLFVDEAQLKQLQESEISFELLKEFQHFHITMLKAKFINATTREKAVQKRYLVRLL